MLKTLRILTLKISRRQFHPGYSQERKLALPKCPSDINCSYYKPVWGNKIQELQLKNDNLHSYNTSNVNFYSNVISKYFKNNVFLLPTSHNTPISTALYSCRNLDADKFLTKIKNIGISEEEVFDNTSENRKKLLTTLNFCDDKKEYNIVNGAIYGIFSNFGDSIYLANDYLQVGKNYLFICNYPDKASQREIERCRIVATSLYYGNMPILLDNHLTFEGEANIKYIPAMIEEHGQIYQLCITYNSSRSELQCIDNINKYLKKLNVPLLKGITLEPKKGMEKYFYHQDCIINFCSGNSKPNQLDENVQIFNSEDDFWKHYLKNGIVINVKQGFDERNMAILNRLFAKILYIDMNDDLLGANMIVNQKGIVGSSKLNNKTKQELKENFPFFLDFEHPSSGGGGSHKCCSNVISKKKSISVDEWTSLMDELGINLHKQFIQGVQNELNRLFPSESKIA